MPRPLRIEYSGAWYHVMNRGANHGNIYHKDKHFRMFLSLLENVTIKYKIQVHAYCLMNNHYHLLLHTPLPNLGKAMRYIDGVYTQRFNFMEKRDGPLFRGRYKGILISCDRYLLQVSRYIHLNPVEAMVVEEPSLYRWSSYNDYIQNDEKHSWLHTSVVADLMDSSDWRNRYKTFVNEGNDIETSQFYSKSRSSIFSDTTFIRKHLNKIPQIRRKQWSTDINNTAASPTLEEITFIVSCFYKTERANVLHKSRGKSNIPRMIAIYLSHLMTNMVHQQIANFFGMERRSVSSNVMRTESLLLTTASLKHEIELIINIINEQLMRK